MLNKNGSDYTEAESDVNDRPPAYNPDFEAPQQENSDETRHAASCREEVQGPPPYYNPDLVENVVWDENTSTESRNNEQAYSEPLDTPVWQNSSSRKDYWAKTKHAAQCAWHKTKQFDETHQITQTTKHVAVQAYKKTKEATVTASHKVQAFDEKHKVVATSKQKLGQGARYVRNKCRRSS